jgi:DNA ligase (NAD+)
VDPLYHSCLQLESSRPTLAYEIDGAVVKVNEMSYQNVIGLSSKSPKWATAFKFSATEATTELLGIDVQVPMSHSQLHLI